MPHTDSVLHDLEGSKCFAEIYLAHAYWKVPLSKSSQEMMSIQTPIEEYSSSRLFQGGKDSGNDFQAVLHETFDERVSKMIQWIDEFLFYGKSKEESLENVRAFL